VIALARDGEEVAGFVMPIVLKRRDGGAVPALMHVRPWHDEAGEVIGADVLAMADTGPDGAFSDLDGGPPPLVAIFSTNSDIARALREALDNEGAGPAAIWDGDALRGRILAADAGLARDRDPSALIFDLAAPYQERWALFQAARRAMPHAAVVFTTPNRNALEKLVGSVDAIEIVDLPSDVAVVVQAVKAALTAGDV
jgi:hypothetical protein